MYFSLPVDIEEGPSGIDKETGRYECRGMREQPKDKGGDCVEDGGNDTYSLGLGEDTSSALRGAPG